MPGLCACQLVLQFFCHKVAKQLIHAVSNTHLLRNVKIALKLDVFTSAHLKVAQFSMFRHGLIMQLPPACY